MTSHFLAAILIFRMYFLISLLNSEIMEILMQKETCEIIDKAYKSTVVKFHDKEKVDNGCDIMKDHDT